MQLLVFLGGLALAIVGGLCEFVGGPAVHGWTNWAMMTVGFLAMAGGIGTSTSDDPGYTGDPCRMSEAQKRELAYYRTRNAMKAVRSKTVPYNPPTKRDASEFIKPETDEVRQFRHAAMRTKKTKSKRESES